MPASRLAEAAPRGGPNRCAFRSPGPGGAHSGAKPKPGNDSERGRGAAGAFGAERELGLRGSRGLHGHGGVGAWATGVPVGSGLALWAFPGLSLAFLNFFDHIN